jgi:hypothetical protein
MEKLAEMKRKIQQAAKKEKKRQRKIKNKK